MLNFSAFATVAAFVACISASCTAESRLADLANLIYAYNADPVSQSPEAFRALPFGSPNNLGLCPLIIFIDGIPTPAAITGAGTYAFAITSRQVFTEVTGEGFVDFPANLTSALLTNVTIGVRDILPDPVMFHATVYLDHDSNCRINKVRAIATIPTEVLGLVTHPPGLSLPF